MNDDQSSAQIVSYRDTKGRFTKGWKGGGRKLGSRHKIAEDFLADFHAVWQEHGLDALRETALAEPQSSARSRLILFETNKST